MRKWLIAWSMLLAATATAAPAWTWVDANGRRHYSDRPAPGATQIDLPTSQTFTRSTPVSRQAAPSPNPTASAPPDSAATQPYTVFDIESPIHQQTLWNIGASLPMTVDIVPELQRTHRLDVIVDGTRVPVGSSTPQFSVPDVFRGQHTLQAVIVDESGREVLRSRSIVIMVQQTSILNPNR